MALFPITFSIAEEKICSQVNINEKCKIMSSLIPGNTSTYIYNTEENYYNEYKQSYFAMTKMKAGWDCLRHYEILANGCVPIFIDIEKCPPNTLARLPKDLFTEANQLYYSKFANKQIHQLTPQDIYEYIILLTKLMEHTKTHLTTRKMAEYVIQKINLPVSRILFLSGNTQPDYLRCLTLHGLKEVFGANCHDFPKIQHIYKSNSINYSGLYGKGMTYTNLLEPNLHNDLLDTRIVEDIKNKYYDIVIYGSYHRGMPYYNLVCSTYLRNEIILFCGEDLHECNCMNLVNCGHSVFIREC